VKDKFTFNKMIFSLGLRVERFDLNSKVLKDPYSLYDIMSADEYFATVPASGKRPEGVGDDFKVYTEGPSDLAPKAFRQGDVWYDANGIQVNDPTVIFGTGGLANALIRDTIIGDEIYDTRYDPNTSFEDYTPQVNWLPRLAFSFPISEEANFFAHYDVLVQRPPDGWQVTALDYAYFYSPGRFGNDPYPNASLRPERVVDYEVGFQQLLSQNSAIKFSAYYRELRDMIQERTYLFVPVISNYQTYGNIDFGTVKGFTVQYDLRRVKNIEFRLAYTLQFADGTGSDANSSNGLTQRGNIRTLYPLNFDERHNIQAIIDYRYGSGKFYNGPRVFGADILSNFGINIQTSAVSGRPYTSTIRADRFGGLGKTSAINGSRKPWRLNVDLRVEKTFVLTAPGKKQMNMTVYFRVQNLLDARNVINVYSYTGSPTDDGFLASPQGQNTLALLAQERRNIPAYTDAYSWRLLDPNNYTQPRRLFLGATFDF
jgi:outer membrane receptor protein involved in Fe transport